MIRIIAVIMTVQMGNVFLLLKLYQSLRAITDHPLWSIAPEQTPLEYEVQELRNQLIGMPERVALSMMERNSKFSSPITHPVPMKGDN